ncbi:MAG: polyprenyl synthetase family protein [Pseudomonadota bacterium]|nr:polyprenyl synthetase family protein [Pseudomonadota bacterium]
MEQTIEDIQQLIANELHELEVVISTQAHSKSELANSVINHLLKAHSKRIRPTIVILSALANGLIQDSTDHIELACIIEYLHTASLLHDDVIDHAKKRRSRDTAHTIWGNTASILSGDFLHAKAFQMTTDLNCYSIQQVLADATENVIEGELEHLHVNRNIKITKMQYLNIIGAKTAKLFTLSSQLGCMLATDDSNSIQAMAEYGHHLGIIFQIVDDCLDYQESNSKLGKHIGQDIQEGKPTLPIIIAYQKCCEQDQEKLAILFRDKSTTLNDVKPFLDKTHALKTCYDEIHTAADLARQALYNIPKTQYRNALENLIEFACKRTH